LADVHSEFNDLAMTYARFTALNTVE